MLVASIVGVDMRATMDIDTTVKALSLNEADVQRIIEEICNIPLEDNVSFQIKSTRTIMEEFDYPGIRVMLEATLDRMRQPIKIDISTDDVITPKADVYSIMNFYEEQIEKRVLYDAFSATCEKRKTIFTKDDIEATLHLISDDLHMEELWEQFKKNNFYVGELEWKSVIDYVEKIMKKNLL